MILRRGNPIRLSLAAAPLLLAGCLPPPPVAKTSDRDRVVAVRTVAVTEAEIQPTTLQPATVHPFYHSEVRPKASGFVSQLHVDIGDVVQAGQVLLEIDVPEMSKQREVIQARITRLQADEKRAVAGVDLADAQVRSSQAS